MESSAGFQFWHVRLNKNRPTVMDLEGANQDYIIHLSGACLGANAVEGRTVVTMKTDKYQGPICVLTYGGQENVQLDLPLSCDQKVILAANGPNNAYLSGYLQPLLDAPEDLATGSGDGVTFRSPRESEVEDMKAEKNPVEEKAENSSENPAAAAAAKEEPKPEKKAPATPSPQKKRKLEEAPKEAPLSKKERKRRKKLAQQEAAAAKKAAESKAKEEKTPQKKPAKQPETASPETPTKAKKVANEPKTAKKTKQWIKKKKGVEIRDMKMGTGPACKWNDEITVKYVGTLEDKTVFDQDLKQGLEFTIGKEVVPGFSIGMVGLRVGGKRRIKVPAAVGYGDKAMGKIPANSTLIFTVQRTA